MDEVNAQERRFFHEQLKTHQLTGDESPEDFLTQFWQQTLCLPGKTDKQNLQKYAKLLLAAHRNNRSKRTDINNVGILRLQAENFARQAKEFVKAGSVKVPDIKTLNTITDIFKTYIELQPWYKNEVMLTIQKFALDSIFVTHDFDRYFPEKASLGKKTRRKLNYPYLKQYFAAQFFISHLNDNLMIEFMMKTLFTNTQYASICWFLDDHFSGDRLSSDVAIKFEKFVYENWRPVDKKFVAGFPELQPLLCKLIESSSTAIYAFLFNLLKRRPLILRQILWDDDEQNPIVEYGIKTLEPDAIDDLIAQLPRAVLESQLLRTVDKGGLITIILREDKKTMNFFLVSIRNSVELGQQSELLTKKFKGTNILLSTANPSHDGSIFKNLVVDLQEQVMLKLIRSKTSGGSHLLHLAMRYYSQPSLEFLIAFLNDLDVLKVQLLEKNDVGHNVLHKAVQNKNPEILTYLIESVLKVELSEREFLDLITGTDELGGTLLHQVLIDPDKNLETVARLFAMIERTVDKTEFQQMLLRRMTTGENLLHLAAIRSDLGIFRLIHAHIVGKISLEVANDMLESRYQNHANVFVSLKPVVAVTKAFYPYFEELLSAEVLQEFLLGELPENRNLLHIACLTGKFDHFKFLFDYLKGKFNDRDFNNLLLSRNKFGSTILHTATKNPHYGFFLDLVGFIEPQMGSDNFRKLLKTKTVLGWNVLHVAATTVNELSFEDAASIVKYELKKEYTSMLSSKTYDDENLIGICLMIKRSRTQRFFKFLLKFLEQELGLAEVKRMLLYTEEDGTTIRQNVANVNVQLFKSVLEHLETVFDVETIQRLLLVRDNEGKSVLHRGRFDEIYSVVKHYVDVRSLLQADDISGNTIIRRTFYNPKGIEILDNELGKAEVDRMLQMPNLFILTCKIIEIHTRDHSMMCRTIDLVAERLGVGVLKEMALYKGNIQFNAFLHLCQGYLDRYDITAIFDCLLHHVGLECFKEVMTAIDSSSGENLFFKLVCSCVQTFQHIVEYLNEKLGPEVVNVLLRANSKTKKESPISIAAQQKDDQVFTYLWSLLQGELAKDEMEKLLQDRLTTEITNNNYRQMKYWHDIAEKIVVRGSKKKLAILKEKQQKQFFTLAAKSCDLVFIAGFLRMIKIPSSLQPLLQQAVKNPHTSVLRKILDICKKNQNTETLHKALAAVDNNGSLLHSALEGGNLAAVKHTIGIMQQELPELDFKAVLLSTNKQGVSLIAQAIINKDKVSFNLILGQLQRYIDRPSLRTMLMKREKGANILVFSFCCASLVYFVFHKLQEVIGIEDTKSMLLHLDAADNDSNILHRYFRTGYKFYMCFVMDLIESVLDRKDIDGMLCASTSYDNNIVHVAFINATGATVEYIFKFLRDNLGREKLKELLCQETKHGSKVFHHAVKESAVPCIPQIYDQLVAEFGDDGVAKELLLADNRFEQNIIYIAARMGIYKYFAFIVDFIRSKTSDAHVKRMVVQLDVNGENLFHAAARNPDAEIFTAATTCLQQYCDERTVKSLLQDVAKNHYNIFHFAVRIDNDLLPIFDFCASMFGTPQAKRMLCATAVRKSNVLHIAARYGASFRPLFAWLKTLLTAAEFHNLLTLNNQPYDYVIVAALEFNKPDSLEEIIDCYAEEIGLDIVKQLLSNPDFFYAALTRVKSVAAVDSLLEQLSRFFDETTILNRILTFDPTHLSDEKEEIANYITTKTVELSFRSKIEKFKETVLHMTIHSEDAETLEKLLIYMDVENSPMLKKALKYNLTNGDNIGHSAVRTKDLDMVAKLFAGIKRNNDALLSTLLGRNSDGLNVVALATTIGSEAIFCSVLDFVAKCDVVTRCQLIPLDRAGGPTIFHLITQEFKNSIVNKSFGVFFKDMTPEAIFSYFITPSARTANLFHIGILRGNRLSVQNIGRGNAALLRTATKNKENVFHLAAQSGKAKMLECLIEVTKEVLGNDEVRGLLTAVDASGSNILHMIALKDNDELMEASIDLLDSELGTGVVRTMVATENHLCHTVEKILGFFEDK